MQELIKYANANSKNMPKIKTLESQFFWMTFYFPYKCIENKLQFYISKLFQ